MGVVRGGPHGRFLPPRAASSPPKVAFFEPPTNPYEPFFNPRTIYGQMEEKKWVFSETGF